MKVEEEIRTIRKELENNLRCSSVIRSKRKEKKKMKKGIEVKNKKKIVT